jgi:Uri superfamily endonuclease
MEMYQSLQTTSRLDMGQRVAQQCWDVCFDSTLTKEELAGGLSEERVKKLGKCEKKCVARHFEVMNLMINSRQQREKEAALGLPPGSLAEEG